MRKKILITTLFTWFKTIIFLYAVPQMQLTPECTAYIENNRYIIHFTLPDYWVEIDDNNNDGYSGIDDECGKFSVIEIKSDYDATDIPGYPVIPFFSLDLLLPNNFSNLNYNINILQSETKILDYRITPAFKGGKYINDGTNDYYIDFDNGNCYNNYYYQHGYDSIYTHGFYPNYIYLNSAYHLYNTTGVNLAIHPFIYRPEANTIYVMKECIITIEFVGDDLTSIINDLSTIHNVSQKVITAHYDTFNDIILTDATHDNGNLLIIAANHGMNSILQPYINHKVNQHYNVDVLYLDYYGLNGNATGIMHLIYNNGLIDNPDYVLLVGSLTDIPPFGTNNDSNPYTDNGYIHPLIGRWIVKGEGAAYPDLENIINKTIYSEQGYTQNNSYGVLFSGTDDRKRISKRFYNRIKKIGDRLCFPYTLYDGRTGTVNFNTICQSLQSHPNIFVYSGHGTYIVNSYNSTTASGVYAPYFILPSNHSAYNSSFVPYNHINGLCNTDPFPMGFGFACGLNTYEVMDNFGARWCAEKYGGVSFYGSTTDSYNVSNNYLSKRVFAIMSKLTNKLGNFPLSLWLRCSEMTYYFALPTSMREKQIAKYNLIGDPTINIYGMYNNGTQAPFHISKEKKETNIDNNIEKICIYDITGALIYSSDVNKLNNNFLNLDTGVYILKSFYDSGTYISEKICIY